MSREVLLKVENLKQHFKVSKKQTVMAVDGISFEILKGETFSLVGESGSGKSTTGRSIIKLYQITDGEIYFNNKRISIGDKQFKRLKHIIRESKEGYDGKKINELRAEVKRLKSTTHTDRLKEYEEKLSNAINTKVKINHKDIEELKLDLRQAQVDNMVDRDFRQKMQMIFQDPMASLNPRKKVIDIIGQGLVVNGLVSSEKEKEEKVIAILEKVGLLKDHLHRYPHQFSGGQRQRIGIARAMIMNPDFVIADEAISALDVSIQAQVINLLKALQEETGVTYLFIAHDLSMVKYISDRVGVMHKGHIVEMGTVEDVYENPVHPYTKSLLSAIPEPNPRLEKVRKRDIYDQKNINYTGGKIQHLSDTHTVLATDYELEKWLGK
ncbi:ATP-binding cassette domain-containing protein [Mycoplasmatota bacterium zrk1]